MVISNEASLSYHTGDRPGKIEVIPTKPVENQEHLSLAYTPGVAIPVLEIEKDPRGAYHYTAKGNLVAVISNGTAILGLGNRGPLASKPVMEGKGVLFKRFADVDVFDIEVDTMDVDHFVSVVEAIAGTFGGINLEDIKAPECFAIEERLVASLEIPVFHDDQHGTAIISTAGLINALEIAGKSIGKAHIVINGAGAAAIACANMFITAGAVRDNIVMLDSRGVLHSERLEGMNPYKAKFIKDTSLRSLADAMLGADVFIGLSIANVVTTDMVRSMADHPIIFAMANPDPEITYEAARAARADVIMATGRSDYPNQVNNVLGFPFIFRGALDVLARRINEPMKLAASQALAELAREPVTPEVLRAYDLDSLEFGPDYIIPKPVDPRVLLWEAPAVARAAMDSGVARRVLDFDLYPQQLQDRLDRLRQIIGSLG
jgi:malate dehydrogenase (oxaloacetate-decarboxylating)(NADP+)